MRWNWTHPDWPNFVYDSAAVEPFERRFLLSSGEILGAVRHVTGEERDRLRIELLSEEAMRTSAIEGEVLDRGGTRRRVMLDHFDHVRGLLLASWKIADPARAVCPVRE